MTEKLRRAIGIVRVSQSAGREGDSFASPPVQRERITAECDRRGLTLTTIRDEVDISGGADLDKRPGLGPAVEAIEAGQADVLVAAYFDRFFRDLTVQSQVIKRIEAAGGQVLAVDFGRVSHGSAAEWLSSSQMGLMSEYYRRAAAERTGEAIQRAINRGVPPWPRITPGYRKGSDGTYSPCPVMASVVRELFEMRANGATVREVRAYLLRHDHKISYAGTVRLLQSPVVLGEIHFGKFTPNLAAHEPIVDRGTWEAVQRARVPSGRNTKSPRLLARLGVLLCGTCDSRLVANTVIGASGKTYEIYRCQNTDCQRRVTIAAHAAETAVVEAAKRELSDLKGRASAAARARELVAERDRAQAELDSAIRVLAVVGDEPAAVERLDGLRAARDRAQAEVDDVGDAAEIVVSVDDWDSLSFDEHRALVRSAIRRAVVLPGRGADRVRVEPFG